MTVSTLKGESFMKKFALIFLLALAARPAHAWPAILMYHDIKSVPVNKFDVSTKNFSAQLDMLLNEGYVTLGLDDLQSASQDFPAKSVIITFDDGYRGVYMHAVPELRKRGMKAVLFIITEMVGRLDTGYPHITEPELREIASDDLFTFGSHTLSHPNLEELSRDQRLHELVKSPRLSQGGRFTLWLIRTGITTQRLCLTFRLRAMSSRSPSTRETQKAFPRDSDSRESIWETQ